jgi:hypothetical protein
VRDYVEQLRETIRLSRDPRRLELDPRRRAELLAAFRAAAGE